MSKRWKLSPWKRGWITRREREAERERQAEQRRRTDAARRGWERRRRDAEERARVEAMRARQRERERVEAVRRKAGKKAAETRRQRAVEAAEKEARRLKKLRKSYRKYLEFRLPKKEREKLEIPEKRELVCKVLFDADKTDPREEHFWSNIRYLIGDSISNQLARIPADEGTVTVWFRVIQADEYRELLAGQVYDPSEMGEIIDVTYDADLEADAFWSTYFDHAREHLPKDASGASDGSLLVVKMQVCYRPGEVSAD